MPIGTHIYKAGGTISESLENAIAKAKAAGIVMKCAQIFVIGPQNTKETLDEYEKSEIKSICERREISLYIHGSYLDNPWGNKPALGRMLIKKELKIAGEIGAKGVVVHLARKTPGAIAGELPRLLEECPPNVRIFLEIESYKSAPDITYENIRQITSLWGHIEKLGLHNKVGLCIDSAHLWAAGVDVSTFGAVNNWLDRLRGVGIGAFLLHLNDQIHLMGSGRDEHAPLAYGSIWGEFHPEMPRKIEDSGLVAFLDWAENENIDAVLERRSDKPKINGRPLVDNIVSDLNLVSELGYFADE